MGIGKSLEDLKSASIVDPFGLMDICRTPYLVTLKYLLLCAHEMFSRADQMPGHKTNLKCVYNNKDGNNQC